MPSPLELQLAVPKPRSLVGESITLVVHHRVTSDLEMETVELNRTRTRLFIRSLGAPNQPVQELSGQDHIALHRVHPLKEVGRRFNAPAGSEWDSQLDLFQYRRPLPPGRYAISISYTYRASPDESVRTNSVEFEVVPATLLTLEYRWFGGAQARDWPASLWTARDGASSRWFYQLCSPKQPAIAIAASDLAVPAVSNQGPPVLAHLNDIADRHFERWVAWLEPGRLGWLPVQKRGQVKPPKQLSHGLAPAPKPLMASPPLQRKAGGFVAVLLGVDSQQRPAVSLVEADAEGETTQRAMGFNGPVPDFAAVLWPDSDSSEEATLYTAVSLQPELLCTQLGKGGAQTRLSAEGPILCLAADQWRGTGRLFALRRIGEELAVLRWNLPAPATTPEVVVRYDLAKNHLAGFQLVDVAPLSTPHDMAILGRDSNGLAVLVASTVTRLPNISGLNRLLAGPEGLFVIGHAPERGFEATRIGPVPPEPMI